MAIKRIRVFLNGQMPATDIPAHRCSKSFSEMLLRCSLAKSVSEDSIILIPKESWRQLKDRFRAVKVAGIPQINPIGYYYDLLLHYPPVPKDANEKRRQAELWMNATNF